MISKGVCRRQEERTHTIWDVPRFAVACLRTTNGASSLEQRREEEREAVGRREEESSLPMMQAESRMVPSECRSHTRRQQAPPAMCNVYTHQQPMWHLPPPTRQASYLPTSQVKHLLTHQWTFCKRGKPKASFELACLDWERKFFGCHIRCVGRMSGGVFRN